MQVLFHFEYFHAQIDKLKRDNQLRHVTWPLLHVVTFIFGKLHALSLNGICQVEFRFNFLCEEKVVVIALYNVLSLC